MGHFSFTPGVLLFLSDLVKLSSAPEKLQGCERGISSSLKNAKAVV